MTKREADKIWRQELRPRVLRKYPNDKPALREAWNDWTDGLCKDGQITQRQYDRWLCPERS